MKTEEQIRREIASLEKDMQRLKPGRQADTNIWYSSKDVKSIKIRHQTSIDTLKWVLGELNVQQYTD